MIAPSYAQILEQLLLRVRHVGKIKKNCNLEIGSNISVQSSLDWHTKFQSNFPIFQIVVKFILTLSILTLQGHTLLSQSLVNFFYLGNEMQGLSFRSPPLVLIFLIFAIFQITLTEQA
jgi:hypothetical protein